jgi:hypothetical protein
MADGFQTLQMVYGIMGQIKNMKKIFIILLITITTSACANNALDIYGMPKPPKNGPAEYIEGWKAGCQTGMTAYSSYYLRTRYSTNVNGEMMSHPHYNTGWNLGLRYCQYYVSTYLSNKELGHGDLRADNTWFSVKSDGFFSYKGVEKIDWMPIN